MFDGDALADHVEDQEVARPVRHDGPDRHRRVVRAVARAPGRVHRDDRHAPALVDDLAVRQELEGVAQVAELAEPRLLEPAPGVRLHVAVLELRPRHGVELGEPPPVGRLIDVRVVLEPRGHEQAALAPPAAREAALGPGGEVGVGHEARLHPGVAGAARVGRGPHPQRHVGQGAGSRLAEPGEQVAVTGLGELGQFVEGDELELGGLVTQLVAGGVEVAEGDRRPARERPSLVAVGPAGAAGPPVVRAVHDRAGQGQVGVGPPQEQRRVAGHADELRRRHQEGVGLPPACRAAVQRLLGVVVQEEQRLLVTGGVGYPRVPPDRLDVALDPPPHRVRIG